MIWGSFHFPHTGACPDGDRPAETHGGPFIEGSETGDFKAVFPREIREMVVFIHVGDGSWRFDVSADALGDRAGVRAASSEHCGTPLTAFFKKFAISTGLFCKYSLTSANFFVKVRYRYRTILEKSGKPDPAIRRKTSHFSVGFSRKSSSSRENFFRNVWQPHRTFLKKVNVHFVIFAKYYHPST